MVISFFLPLKVVFLLGSDEVPAYFDTVYSFSSMNQLIGVLVFFSAVSYFLFLAGNRYAEFLSAEGARKVVASTSKLTLFQNQDELARRSYLRIGNVFAAILFMLFSMGLFFVLYRSLFFIILLCVIVTLGGLQLLFALRPRLIGKTASSPGPFVSQLYGVFFIVLFGFMVSDLLFWSDVGVYVALVCLLLVRQLLQRLTTASIDGVILYGTKGRVNRIFLTAPAETLEPEELPLESVTSVLSAESSHKFAERVLRRFVDKGDPEVRAEHLELHFFQSSIVDIITLKVIWMKRHFLVKLFDARHKLLADREEDLLSSVSDDFTGFIFSSLELSDARKVHVFEFLQAEGVVEKGDFKSRRDTFRLKCFTVCFADRFHERYLSSHAFVWSRLKSFSDVFDFPVFDGLFLTMTSAEFVAEVHAHIRTLPIVLCPQDVTDDSLTELKGGNVTNIHWERWSLEPVGFGLTEAELNTAHLRKLLDQSAIAGVDERIVRLSGLCCLLEQKIRNQKFLSAKNIISTMIEMIEVLSHERAAWK